MTIFTLSKYSRNLRERRPGSSARRIERTAWILLLCLTAFLCGCGKKTEGKSWVQEQEDVMEISIAVWNADQGFAGDEVLSAVEEKFHVRFVPMDITWDDYYQRIEYWASTGGLPDLFIGDFRHSEFYMEWVQQGLLKEIPQDLSDYPYLQEYMENSVQTEDAEVDGKIYCIPRLTYPEQAWTSIDRVISYRWDLAQQAGITKEPETGRNLRK